MASSLLIPAPPPINVPPPKPLKTSSPSPGKLGFLFLFAAFAAALLWVGYSRYGKPAAKPAPSIRTATAQIGMLKQTVRLTGMTLAADAALVVAPRLRGRRSRNSSQSDFRLTLKTLIPSGSRVKAGDLVAEFDRQFMEVRLDDLEADVRGRELTLKTVRADIAVNRKAYDQRILAAEGAVEKARLDLRTIAVRSAIVAEQYRLNLEEARAHLEQLRKEAYFFDLSERAAIRRQELELAEEKLDLSRSRRNSERMRIHAPIDGVFVPQRIRRGGEYKDIQAGDELRSGYVIGEIHDTSSLVVEASLNQADIHDVRPGMPATITAEAFGDLSLPARVMRVGTLTQARGARAEYVRTLPVRLKVLGHDPRLMPNYTVSVDIAAASVPDAVLIPREAVGFDPNGAFVRVRTRDGWRRQPIDLGARNNVKVAVASGITQGEVVALETPKSLQ